MSVRSKASRIALERGALEKDPLVEDESVKAGRRFLELAKRVRLSWRTSPGGAKIPMIEITF
jgi:hypothetical protein